MTADLTYFTILFFAVTTAQQNHFSYNHPPWTRINRQNFMAPMQLYEGVPLSSRFRPTAPPIATVASMQHNKYGHNMFTTRTTYFIHSQWTTPIASTRRFRTRRRNRTRTTTPSEPQYFGIQVNVYDPIETTSSSTTTPPWWWQPATTTTKSFYELFPKLPSQRYRPPPPTVPRSFTATTRLTYPSTTTTTTTPTTITTTTTTTTVSTTRSTTRTTTFTRPTSTSSLPRPFDPPVVVVRHPPSSWLFSVPSLSLIIDQYPRYPTIIRWFDELSKHPNISRFFAYDTVGLTHENRSIVVAKIGLMPFRANRRSVWLDGGIHAREWISTATVLYTIARLINGTLARDSEVRQLIDSYDFYFMPVVNPDGYVFTHDEVPIVLDTELQELQQDQRRMWRKNRRPHNECPGVDLNRNFAFAWDNRGASKFPCEETYRGPYPESEPEVRALTSFILQRRRHFQIFITLHAFGNFWMMPFSFSTRIRPHNYDRTRQLLARANRLSSNTFKIGQSSTLLYSATGTSEDWAKAIAQIPHTFSVELPPSTDAFDIRQDELNGFTFYSDKDIGAVAESTYRLLHIYIRDVARTRQQTRTNV